MAVTTIEEAVNELSTVRDLIRWGMSLFEEAGLHYGHGTENARDEAAYLVLHALHLPPDINEGYFAAHLTKREREIVSRLLLRRAQERIPAPYLTGEAWFMGLPFHVNEHVLIPRSPIAELIQVQFEPWTHPDRIDRILDLCTGSGCIGIACAISFPEAEVDASDVSSEALAVAEGNVARHHVEEQVRLVQSDLFRGLEGERYDIIVSNPPYVDARDMAELPPEFRHEPARALAAGQDGLDLVRVILRDAVHHLNPDGVLIVEVGNSALALEDEYAEVPFTWLDFEQGDAEVFLLTADQVAEYHDVFAAACPG